MTQSGKLLAGVAGGIVLCLLTAAAREDASNPYQNIVDRNVFGLKPVPVEAPKSNEPPKPPPPPITLQGISTMLGGKKAFLKATPPSKDKGPAVEQNYMLAEGERDGEIEVLEIDPKAGMVKVNDYGTITNLTFLTNGVKGGSVASAPNTPAPAAPTPPPNPFAPPPGQRNFQRPLRLPVAMGGGHGVGAAQSFGGGGAFAGGGTPSVNVGGQNLSFQGYGQLQQQAQQQQAANNGLSPEANAILTEANYQAAKAANDPSAALFPPSALDPTRNMSPQPGAEGTTPGTQTTTPTTQQPQLPIPGRPPRPF